MSTDSLKNPLEEQRSPFSHSNPFPQKPEMKVRRPHVVILDDSMTSQEGMPKMSAKEELESSVPTERSDPRYHESQSTVTREKNPKRFDYRPRISKTGSTAVQPKQSDQVRATY